MGDRAVKFLAIAIFVLVAACAKKPDRGYELSPSGVMLCIDRKSDAYRDISAAMRRDQFEDLMNSAPGDKRTVTPPEGVAPLTCDVGRKFPKALNINYAPRTDKQVGATLRLYYDNNQRVAAAEFYIIDLAP